MKTITHALAVFGTVVACYSAVSESVGAGKLIEPIPAERPSKAQRAQIDRKYGMFCHFGINTYAGSEWTDGTADPSVFNPPADIAQQADDWVRFARDAGMRYFLCITKHHDGFCMWPTKLTDYSVANPKVKVQTDIVRAISDACKKYGIAFAVYYSSWDRHESTFKDPAKYKEFVKAQLTELLTNYGPVCELWFDGSWVQSAENWYQTEIYDLVKRLQPDCQVTMNWTIGLPGKPDTHNIKPEQQQQGYPIRYWPCDFRIADPFLPRSDDPKLFSHGEQLYYMPFEATVTVAKNNQWFGLAGDQGAKTPEELEKILFAATANDNLLVLNIPPFRDGKLIPSQVAAVMELAKRLNLGPGKPFPTSPAPSLVSQHAADYKAMRVEVDKLANLTRAPKYEVVARGDATPNLKPILYTGPDYQGKPTEVFAWLGLPEKRAGKVPAVVLVHGGGGTASKAWVENWNNHGYAAISMSLEGYTDNHTRLPDGGPARPGIFGDSSAPIKDQWMYQSVANVTLAAALLRSLPEVDPDKVGIVGCSWGGIITTTVIGIDPRYAFAIPVYGCGGLDAIPNQYGGSLAKNEVYKSVWDANLRLDRARMPILWLSWPQDTHFPMDAVALSSKKAAHSDSLLCLIPGMGHGNLTDRPEWFAFADSVLKEGRPWILEKSSKFEGGKLEAVFDSTKPLESAVLISTTDSGLTGSRKWIESPATVSKTGDQWIAGAAVPEGTTACFINVKSGQLTATSNYHEIK